MTVAAMGLCCFLNHSLNQQQHFYMVMVNDWCYAVT